MCVFTNTWVLFDNIRTLFLCKNQVKPELAVHPAQKPPVHRIGARAVVFL